MADYESLAHLPRWRRVLIWLAEHPTGRLLWMLPALFLIASPVYFIGLWWIAVVGAACFSFVLGWNLAVRKLKRDGYLDKL